MFNALSDRLHSTLQKLRGTHRLSEENIQGALQEVRVALLEADVALPVVKDFIEHVQAKAIGQDVLRSLRPAETLVKVVHDELIHLLGDQHAALNLGAKTPIVILMAGLQGSGKTTSAAKLALHLKQQQHKSVMMVSADIYRPAAIEQLAMLTQQVGATLSASRAEESPSTIVTRALAEARTQAIDVLIIDTAGRLHIDQDLMNELKEISALTTPTETLLVVDSMMGQDAAHVAKRFNEDLHLSGIILTKMDGDARGGAALSMRMITGKAIKFMGVGEKIEALEVFHPERIASRLLGMGDILSLVEEVTQKVDKAQAEKFAQKMHTGDRFDFNDFLAQLQQMHNMGGMQSLLNKLPTLPGKVPGMGGMLDDTLFSGMEAIIYSMTPKERCFPALITGSRKRRIAAGSGRNPQEVNKLLSQFEKMQKMMKKFKGNKMMNKLKALQGQLPPELMGKLPPL